jgi:hypothetical protein
MSFDPDEVQSALRKGWSLATAMQWTASIRRQDNATSLRYRFTSSSAATC